MPPKKASAPPFDIPAREKQVLGNGPRIEPISPDAVPSAAWERAEKVWRSAGATNSSLSPHMRTMLKHRDVFNCQMDFSTVIFSGKVPPRERELAVLRIGWLARAPFEWGEHVRIGRRSGISSEEIEWLIIGSSAPGWNPHEAAILRGVEELLTDQALTDETWTQLSRSWDEVQMIELLALAGHYLAIAFIQNSLRIQLRDDNEGFRAR